MTTTPFFDRVRETSVTTGLGNLTLAGAVVGFRAFSAVYANNDGAYYCITHTDGTWEIGIGRWLTGDLLTRDTLLASSTGSFINFAAGTKQVFTTLPAGAIGQGPSEFIHAGTTLTLTAAYKFRRIRCTSVTGCVITVPDNVFAAQDWTEAYAAVAGQKVTWVAGGTQVIEASEGLTSPYEFAVSRLDFRSAATSTLSSPRGNYSSGTVTWDRTNGQNSPKRTGVISPIDYGARALPNSSTGARCNSLTSGSVIATLLTDGGLQNGDHVVVFGAGPAHTMMTPALPNAVVVGPAGTTLREYCFSWVDDLNGWSAASPIVSVVNAPDILTDPRSKNGQGTIADGGWVRFRPNHVDCYTSSITNLVLSGIQTIDGVVMFDGRLTLCLGQTNPAENGPWVQHAGAWTRPVGFAVSGDLAQGMTCRSRFGAVRTRTLWQLSTAGPYTLGVTGLTFTPLTARMGCVWHRANGGPWEIAGGFTANGYLSALVPQFNDKGHRPTGVMQYTIPNTIPAAAPVPGFLRTRIISGGGTTTVTLENPALATIVNMRIDNCAHVPLMAANAAALANGSVVEFPAGNFKFFSDVLIESQPSRRFRGVGVDKTILLFGPMSNWTFGDNGGSCSITDLRLQALARTFPAGLMGSVPYETDIDAINPDLTFDGSGLVFRSNDCLARNVRVQGFYGNAVTIRGNSSEATNANRTNLEHVEVTSCYGNGIQYGGGDGNAGIVYRCSVVNCYGEGFNDASFLGNTWIGCHVSGNHLRAYSSREPNTCNAVFLGCYAEGGSNMAVRIAAAGMWIGGDNGAGLDPFGGGSAQRSGISQTPVDTCYIPSSGVWTAGALRQQEDYTLPTLNNGWLYRVVRAQPPRTTGGVEPVWPLTPGATVVDGNITWVNTGLPQRRILKFGDRGNPNLLMSFTEDGNRKGLNHTMIVSPSTDAIAYGFFGSLNSDAMRWLGLIGDGLVPRATGMIHFPTFVQVGNVSLGYRRFGWSTGAPDFVGPYSSGDTFVDISGTGRVYRAAADFALGSATWLASHAYNQGEVVTPVTPDGFVYVQRAAVNASNSAVSGSVEPVWGGGTITDGQCKWVRHGVATPRWEVSVEMKGGAHLLDADAVITLAQGHKRVLHVPLTANRIIDVANTGAPATGAMMSIVRMGLGNFTLTIRDQVSGLPLHVIPSATPRQVDIRWDSVNWQGPETGAGGWTDIT